MTPAEYDAQWVCGYCYKTHPVPSMARHCEAKHEQEEQDESKS